MLITIGCFTILCNICFSSGFEDVINALEARNVYIFSFGKTEFIMLFIFDDG